MSASLIDILGQYGYKVYSRPYELNIVGIRTNSTDARKFNDCIHVFFKTINGIWTHKAYCATTDPGTYWLQNPLMPEGTAILKAGQYESAYMLGLHRNSYRALVQRKAVTVIRDYDRDAFLDFYNGREETGYYGINLHRAVENGVALLTDKISAGCQVFQSSGEFDAFISLCDEHAKRYGNQFTYTLLDERALKRMRRKELLLIGALACGGGIATVLIVNHFENKL